MTQSTNGRTAVTAPDAPAAIGPYSHAVSHDGLLFCSGALPLDPDSGEMVDDSVGAETTRCLENLAAVCRAAGTELSQAVQLTVYTTRLELFAEINEAYGAFFADSPPARVAIGVAALPKGAGVEIAAVVATA
ncbi:MAG TPA: Rid family detoxifying hydrolase [Solirubrobacterales bacterium]|jgi:2-iminobutanoate/2-iminopropanoate deaminase